MMPVMLPSHRFHRARRGQALVIVALMMIVLMGGLGLALDGGYNFAQRRTMQNAADAAALAGAKALSINDFTKMPVRATVRTVAGQNGVADPTSSAQLTCVYLNNRLEPLNADGSDTPCKDENFVDGVNVSAVRVTVTEVHTTFVMRALGIPTSSTSATATAQVQQINSLPNNQVVFVICGIDAVQVTSNGNVMKSQGNTVTMDILETLPYGTAASPTNYLQFSGDATKYKVTKEPPTIPDSAYAINWAPTPPATRPILPNNDLEGPRFLVHGVGADFARCTAGQSYMGFNGRSVGSIEIVDGALHMQCTTPPCTATSTTPWQYTASNTGDPNGPWAEACDFCGTGTVGPVYNSTIAATDTTLRTGGLSEGSQGNAAGLASKVPGAGGCPPAADPKDIANCVMILPLVDNSVDSPNGANLVLAVRKFVAVYITKNSNGTEHYGQLIKNYNFTMAGTATWTPGSTGLPTIRLVR